MSGPYGADVEFVLVVGLWLLFFLMVCLVIEVYLESKKKK
jgi:hypothetical protein